jgi:hypothetical protein
MRLLQRFSKATLCCVVAMLPNLVLSDTLVSIEAGPTWQSRNDVQIPGDSGTRFSLADLEAGPFYSTRAYLGHKFSGKHELRLLYAPLSAKISSTLGSAVSFAGQDFAAGIATNAVYKFNSYRLTYAYHFEESNDWAFALGFTAKIRDAKIELTQGTTTAKKENVGFVPLLNFQALRNLGDDWRFRFDVDGLAAPQGRAIDAALFAEYTLTNFGAGHRLSAFTGYRTVEGGADNDVVYNFAWLHTLVFGIRGDF